jgi:uncharacterized membrane protein
VDDKSRTGNVQLLEPDRAEQPLEQPPRPAPRPAVARPRLDSVDRLRGLVMALMALDHVRDFFGDCTFDAVNDMAKTTVPVYFTRWVSHFCAPTFVFLTGVGIYLYSARGRTKPEMSWYLITRGLWIIFLEAVVLTPMWRGGDYSYRFVFGQVFWAIGVSMIVLAGLVWLPRAAILLFALLLIGGHNLFDEFRPEYFGSWAWLWRILHVQDGVPLPGGITLLTAYPLIPWIGIMAAGYLLGPVLKMEKAERRTWILGLGALMTVGFFVLRAANVYGDPHPWRLQRDETYTVLSFLNTHKYPPSLCYFLMTIGPALLLLAAFEGNWGPLGSVLTVFGRVPLFYYLLHLPLILGSALLTMRLEVALGHYESVDALLKEGGLRYGLPYVYLIWLAVLVILYFPCRWYAGVKMRSSSPWLTYL